MIKNKPRLTVTKKSSTGMNIEFLDNKTGEKIGRREVAHRIDEGTLPGYIHYPGAKGQLIIRSNANKSTEDNLG